MSIDVGLVQSSTDRYDEELVLGAIRIPFLKQIIHLSNDSVHCIDERRYDAKAILTM